MKKKVIFFIESFIVGGAEKVLIDIVNNLDAEKYDITVCSIFKHSVYKGYNSTFETPFAKHVKYKFLINNKNRIAYLLFNYLLARIPHLLYSLLVGDKYDTVVAFYEGTPTYWVANAKLAKAKKIAWLHTSTELSQNGKSKSELEKQNNEYSSFEHIVAVSQDVAKSFTNLFTEQKEKIKVINNPINTEIIRKKATAPIDITKGNETTFVCVGRLNEVKGYDRWLKVLLNLKNRGYNFTSWIIGGGDSKPYQEFIDNNNLQENVKLLGHKDNPYPYIMAADWVACPSRIEGLSTVVMEALVLGKPIMATDCPGMKELLGDNEYGIVVDNNEKAIEDGLLNILENISDKKKYETKASIRGCSLDIKRAIDNITIIL
jgi:glycosyltransferase involved in cell wall biosynthesis